jgi:uncharacterized protein YdeI (YjbR/CyaY-like superfamily)
MNPKVDFYFSKPNKWQEEIVRLRTIVLDCGLQEELKWGVPCYTLNQTNIVLIHTFKDYCALLFFKGALLKDPKKILIQQTKNVQAARQIRFSSVSDIIKVIPLLKRYIYEAIEVEKARLKVNFKKSPEYSKPKELEHEFRDNPGFKKAFEALTPGRQRAYLLYFSAPKQSKTREARIEKYRKQILNGKGLNDK